MPELPEVENYRKYLEGTSLHQKIVSFSCLDDRLLKMHPQTFREHLLGVEFTDTQRIGKYLFVKTDGDRVLVMHFGMTGKLAYYKDKEDRPKFAHIEFEFDNGFHLGFENKRKFGWMDLAESVEAYQKKVGLSTDARELSFEDFSNSLSSRKTAIKSILLDQSVAAGIGNWMADEILYQAKLHPESRVEDMNEQYIKTVYEALKEVVSVSVEKEAVYEDFPENWLLQNRSTDGICYHTGKAIEKTKVGGRSTYFSPEWQKLIRN